jgi:hypothetical protein
MSFLEDLNWDGVFSILPSMAALLLAVFIQDLPKGLWRVLACLCGVFLLVMQGYRLGLPIHRWDVFFYSAFLLLLIKHVLPGKIGVLPVAAIVGSLAGLAIRSTFFAKYPLTTMFMWLVLLNLAVFVLARTPMSHTLFILAVTILMLSLPLGYGLWGGIGDLIAGLYGEYDWVAATHVFILTCWFLAAAIALLRVGLYKYVDDPGRCAVCSYCLRGLPSDRCPECGTVYMGQSVPRLIPRRQRR